MEEEPGVVKKKPTKKKPELAAEKKVFFSVLKAAVSGIRLGVVRGAFLQDSDSGQIFHLF